MKRAVRNILAVIGAISLPLSIILLWSVKRRRRPRISLEEHSGPGELFASIVGLTQSTLVRGNDVQIVQNGAFFDRLYEDLENARASINVETFLAEEGEVTHRLAEILSRKCRQGVHVRVIIDQSAHKKFGKGPVEQMREAGCQVRSYHPLRISNLGRLNNRTHRKIVVIDGKIGYVGGHCMVDSWLGNAEDLDHFRDISARVEGPVVMQLQSAFSENWVEETGEVFGGPDYFPELQRRGETDAYVVFVSPSGAPSTMKLLYYLAIRAAQKSITIQNPYFLPDPDAIKGLDDAVKRGVNVRIMLPSDKVTDEPMVQHASHHRFGALLEQGVKIYEHKKTLTHQKVITVDGCWSVIGSTNFDDRSLEINDEVAMVIHGDRIARELEEIFEQDLKNSTQQTLEGWKSRTIGHKLKDFGFFLINEQL